MSKQPKLCQQQQMLQIVVCRNIKERIPQATAEITNAKATFHVTLKIWYFS